MSSSQPVPVGDPRGLTPLQRRVLDCLESDNVMMPVWEIAQEVFGREDAPLASEKKSVYGCLKRLEKRGLIRGRPSWLRDIGPATVWRSLIDPSHRVLDPGG